MTYPAHETILRATAEMHGLDPALVAAVVDRETAGSWSEHSSRYERGYIYTVHPTTREPMHGSRLVPTVPPFGWPSWIDSIRTSGSTEYAHQRTSWGLMHVMGAVAREMGFQRELPALTEPHLGLEYGCRHLARYVNRYGVRGGLDAYNDGRADGAGPGASYATDVLQRMEQFRG